MQNTRNSAGWSLLLALTLGSVPVLRGRAAATMQAASVAVPPSLHGPFHVRSYLGKCLTYGALQATDPTLSQTGGSPVYVQDCHGGSPLPHVGPVEQDVVVAEFGDRHEVRLRAGDKVIGIATSFLIAQAGLAIPETPLELQDEVEDGNGGQVFALDGDSIILAADRDLVVKVKNGRGANLTPLVLGRRDLDDSEFWTFVAVDGTDQRPTSGFVRVPQEKDLGSALGEAGWGTVVEVDGSASINLRDYDQATQLQIPAGVTIRGDRRGTLLGPELGLPLPDSRDHRPLRTLNLQVAYDSPGDWVRITGLRLHGPSRSHARIDYSNGIFVDDRATVIIDHNDLSGWTQATVNVDGDPAAAPLWACPPKDDAIPPTNVRLVRNFIHHNERDGGGYGVVVGANGRATITGNTFLMNRHAIAGKGAALSGYSAWFNLILSHAPQYGFNHEHDFDMHGSDLSSHHTGGIGGSDIEIARNTFLGTDRLNFNLRGVSCGLDRLHDNVSRQGDEDALRWYVAAARTTDPGLASACRLELLGQRYHQWFCGYQDSPSSPPPPWLDISDSNRFGASPDPTARLGVGDFDGDGKDDLFLATGAAWYYAPRGKAEWRYRNAQTEEMASLRFGDFDGDGRTDVFTQRGRDWLVSWGGASQWEKINESDAGISDFAIGDFDGDHRADVFYADGSQWWVSHGGVGPFTPYAASNHQVPDLRFGDFDGDGRTDVLGVVHGYWQVSYGGTESWSPLRSALTSTVRHLVVADFDGDGRADIATSTGSGDDWQWKISRSGIGRWTLRMGSAGVALDQAVGVGRFDNPGRADVLVWDGRLLDIVVGGLSAQHRQSRQDMR